MILDIHHQTSYQYSQLVFVEPHHLYFYPAHRNYIQLKNFEIAVSPEPAGLGFRLDAENNPFHQVWFNEQTDSLKVDVKIQLETIALNPYDFLIEEPTESTNQALANYLSYVPNTLSDQIVGWLSGIKNLAGENLLTFITYLNNEIHSGWVHEERYAQNILTPLVCFEDRKGSCRDLSWMMIQMCRSQRIAARFVSGYAFNPELKLGHELHAWVEAWLPGAGWVGFDPSSGLLATDLYIPTCTSYTPENTLPVQGSIRGAATSELSFEVEIKTS